MTVAPMGPTLLPPAPTPASIPLPPPLPPTPSLAPSGVPKCAIAECPRPTFVDESGQAHECCGYTHAMEHQRRLALLQRMLHSMGIHRGSFSLPPPPPLSLSSTTYRDTGTGCQGPDAVSAARVPQANVAL